jgi:hypothetical protein
VEWNYDVAARCPLCAWIACGASRQLSVRDVTLIPKLTRRVVRGSETYYGSTESHPYHTVVSDKGTQKPLGVIFPRGHSFQPFYHIEKHRSNSYVWMEMERCGGIGVRTTVARRRRRMCKPMAAGNIADA